MIEIDSVQVPENWAWFKERTHVLLCEDTHGFVIKRDGRILAACVFDTVTPVACNVHLAIDDPLALRHGLLEMAAQHVFEDMGKNRLFGLVPTNNPKALKMNKHVGFEVIAEIPNTMDEGVGTYVMEITRERAQRWLPKKEAA